jgi:hypothetical protein
MGFLRRKVPTHYIPIHPHNVSDKDCIILSSGLLPSEKLPDRPVIAPNGQLDFESLVVEPPAERRSAKPRAVP